MKIAFTVAGSDPTGGAGLQADLKVFKTFNVHGLSVVSAITAQSTAGVDTIFPVDKETFERQISVLLRDIKPDALKLGMIYSKWATGIIGEALKKFALKNFVIDPVTVSSSGASLVDSGTLDSIRDTLFPLSKVITPNIYEASVLSGVMIENRQNMEEAAKILKDMGPEVVVITGGHLEGIALDLYYDGDFYLIKGEKIRGEYHGTGCAFSAAITALLADGHIPLESVRRAKEFVTGAIKKAYHPGKGMGLLEL